MSVMSENRLLLGLVERPPQFLFLVPDLRENVVGQLVDDVFLLGRRQVTFDGVDVAVDEVHPELLQNPIQRRREGLPVAGELRQRLLALPGQPVEPFVSLVFLAPFGHEQPLALESPQQGVDRPFVHDDSPVCQRLSQRVAVVLGLQLPEHGQNQAPASQFQAEVFDEGDVHRLTMRHILVDIHCMQHTV